MLGLLGSRMVGPISDTSFIELMETGEIDRNAMVQSPELTRNREIEAGRVNLCVVRDMCSQRVAEEQRLQRIKERENQRDANNRNTLLNGIRKAISDGNLSLIERTQISEFASKVGITDSEVGEILKRESSMLLRQMIEDAVSDGFFDDKENEKISKVAIGLGLTLEFSNEQHFRLSLARIAWNLLQQLRSGQMNPTLEFEEAEVFEIVSLKRPAGIPLGDDHYLKSIGIGAVKRVDKNFILDGRLTAKKYALSSVVSVQWFSDGLFLKRSSGKSLFIRPLQTGLIWHQFAMTMEVLATGEPVVGVLPDESFIPATNVLMEKIADGHSDNGDRFAEESQEGDLWTPGGRTPRFTFRVVGESYDNRHLDLDRLSIGESVYLAREPNNPYDSNAVIVTNSKHRSLGYLKREVSVWFAPILDKGRKFDCVVKQRTSSGGIIIGLYE
ncbi:HIRAN domain-containing protein [Pirellulaceae bacterium SH449]